jgi:hypothetical protein
MMITDCVSEVTDSANWMIHVLVRTGAGKENAEKENLQQAVTICTVCSSNASYSVSN